MNVNSGIVSYLNNEEKNCQSNTQNSINKIDEIKARIQGMKPDLDSTNFPKLYASTSIDDKLLICEEGCEWLEKALGIVPFSKNMPHRCLRLEAQLEIINGASMLLI